MANAVEVTKVRVDFMQKKLYNIVLNLVYKEDTVEKLNKDFSISYAKGEPISPYTDKLQVEMQDAIDGYQAAQLVFNNAALDTAASDIQSALDAT